MYRFILIITGLAILALLGEIFYVMVQKSSRLQSYLLLLLCSTLIMLVGYMAEILAEDETPAFYGCIFSYIGKPMALFYSTLFISEYCGFRPYERHKVLVILWFIFSSCISLIVATTRITNLFYSSVTLNLAQKYSPLVIIRGPLYYLYAADLIAAFGISFALLFQKYRASKTKETKQQVIYLSSTLLCTALGYLLYMLGITNGYDSTMAGAAVGAYIIFALFVGSRFFDYISLAKEHLLEASANGLVVFNAEKEIVYKNGIMDELLGSGAVTARDMMAYPDGKQNVNLNSHVYEVTKNQAMSRGVSYGTTLEFIDVTEKVDYSNRLERAVDARTAEIRRMQTSLIASFAGIVEARDSSTGEHVNRVRYLVESIARQMKKDGKYPELITESYVQRLANVSPLHDIGKISISDSILKKPGRLTDEEFEVIKTHTTKGAQIIQTSMEGIETPEYLKMARDVALYHHERWDGKGYPSRLAGKEIPLSARIVAIADVYDAVRSERCYKPPLTPEQATGIVLDENGTHFDPDVVEAFLKVQPTFESLFAHK